MRAAILAGLFFVVSCKSERDLSAQTWTDSWDQAPNNQVDILWVIDDSYSMALEQEALANGFQSFISEMENTGTDFHLAVITTSFEYTDPNRGVFLGTPPVITNEDDYVTLFQQRVQVGVDGADKEKGLEAATYALSSAMTSGPNSGFLRREASLLVVVLSDENDCSDRGALEAFDADACYQRWEELVPVSTFVAELRDLKDDPNMVQLGAIVGPEQTNGCIDAVTGRRYLEAASLTGGVAGDICKTDWSGMLYDLGLDASGVKSRFQLSRAANPETIVVTVDDVEIPESATEGWTYDGKTWYLTFHGASVPEREAVIKATYEVAPGSGPAEEVADTGLAAEPT